MNTAGDDPQAIINPAVWLEPEIRSALRVRDIGAVYRQLKRHGVSQRRIAVLTEQSQPEVSGIMNGRQVMAYDVLSRIADGLGVPRGLMGLAYDNPGMASWGVKAEGDSDVERRGFIGLVAKAAVVGLNGAELDRIRVVPQATPVPGLHQRKPESALKMFQLGQMSAQDAGSHRAEALLCLNTAWAHAEMGNAGQVRSLLARASDEFARDSERDTPAWLDFMGAAEIEGIAGVAYTILSHAG